MRIRSLIVLAAGLAACSSGTSQGNGGSGGSGNGGSDGGAAGTGGAMVSNPGDSHYKVDQFGYLPGEEKVAVISSAQVGFDAPDAFTPGSTLEVHNWPADQSVFSGPVTEWNGGATDALAGDKGWWFDFSSVKEPGDYVIWDPQNQKRSHVFRIGKGIYDAVLVQALRTYFYQREGFAKQPPYTDARWADTASHSNDTKARSVFPPSDASTERDVSGGWMDAGDQNKYVTFLDETIPHLLYAFVKYPEAFGDANNIPESGNGIPDVLDEVQWEIDWMLKMQDTDGGVFIKAGCTDTNDPSPPSSDVRPRFYGKKCTSSTIAFAGIIAQTAYVYRDIPALAGKTASLTAAAEKAWTWFQAQPSLDGDCDKGEIKSGDADRKTTVQEAQAAQAAMWLYALTDRATYHDYFKTNYTKLNGISQNWWGPYQVANDDAAFFYNTLPGADATVKAALETSLANQKSGCSEYYTTSPTAALYRAYMPAGAFHWGSNLPRAAAGSILMRMIDFGVGTADHDTYRGRALQHLHWLHGVNALGEVYLSNMASFGAEKSVDQFFHTWFAHGTEWDSVSSSPKGPPPGYVPGGPNTSYAIDGWYPAEAKLISPPYGQPGEKSYKDFNESWPGCSYAVTENAIYYQANYVRLLASVIHASAGL